MTGRYSGVSPGGPLLSLGERLDVGGGAGRQALEVVAALQGGDDAAAATPARDLQHAAGHGGEMLRLQVLAGQGVAAVRVEAGGDQDELRLEGVERGEEPGLERAHPDGGRSVGGDGDVEDVAHPAFGRGARAGVERPLMDGAEEDVGLGFEGGLSAVAVVDVEIDDADAPGPRGLGGANAYGHAGEEAEAHGLFGFGVVAGRTHCAEGAVGLAGEDGADGLDGGPGGQPRGAQAAGGHGRVGVELAAALRRFTRDDSVDVALRMDAEEVGVGHLLGGAAVYSEAVQGLEHGGQARGTLRVSVAVVVGQHVGVGEEEDAHGRLCYPAAMLQGHRIRRAGFADAEALAALGRATFVETFVEGFGVPYPPEDLSAFMAHSYSASFNAARLADPEQAVWAVEADGRLIAYAAAGPAKLLHPELSSTDGELYALYVRREAQGYGLGRALLELALEWLEAGGPRRLWLSVWSGNDKAQRLYARYGFTKAGEYAFPVGRWRDHEFIFRRDPAMLAT